jgi:flagellar biosynthesis protein FlhB
MSSILKRKDVILTITAFCFGLTVVPYFFNTPSLNTYANKLSTLVSVVTASAIFLSLYSQVRRSATMAMQRVHGWAYQVYLLIALYAMIFIGLVYGQGSTPYLWLQFGIQLAADSCVPVLVTFSLLSSAARSYRMRNLKATILIVVGLICIAGYAPLTSVYTPIFDQINTFIQDSFARGGTRALTIATALGGLIVGVRTLVGREPAALGIIESEEAA